MLVRFVDMIIAIPLCLSERCGDFQHAILCCCDCRGIVKLKRTSTCRRCIIVTLIQRCPNGIVAILKGTIGNIELIRHDLKRREKRANEIQDDKGQKEGDAQGILPSDRCFRLPGTSLCACPTGYPCRSIRQSQSEDCM